MKGLLLKDFYMSLKYCKVYLFVTAVCIAASVFGGNNQYFMYFPCFIMGMLPVTLLGYDEQSKWNKYCETMPYTKTQIVLSKYIVGLVAQCSVFILFFIAQAVNGIINNDFNILDYLITLTITFAMSSWAPPFCMPFIFKYGINKGRVAYSLAIGIACASGYMFLNYKELFLSKVSPALIDTAVCIFSVLLYALSLFISVTVYKRREVN